MARLTVTDDDGDSDTDVVTIGVTRPRYDFEWVAPTVGPPARNRFVAGEQADIHFTLGDDYGLNIFRDGWPMQQRYVCGTRYDYFGNARGSTRPFGSQGLSYDAGTDVYTYSWDTFGGWDGQCRQFRLRLRLEAGNFPYHFVDVKFRQPVDQPT